MLKAVCNFKKSKKGFTLIELLIVVAIIAILAAIAIPQFSQYRVRGYNSAASSDVRNIKVQVEAFNTDWQVYASSAALGAIGVGSVVSGPSSQAIAVAQGGIIAGSPGLPSAAATFTFGVSNGVQAVINTTAATAAGYLTATKHASGDRGFCADSNITSINWVAITAGSSLANAGSAFYPASTTADNCVAVYPSTL